MNTIPTLQEELDRKTFETVQWLLNGYIAKRISPSQLSTAIDAIFMTTNGLVDGEIFKIISEISKELPEVPPFKNVAHVLKGDCAFTLEHICDQECFTVTCTQNGKKAIREKAFETSAEAAQEFDILLNKLLEKGFEKL